MCLPRVVEVEDGHICFRVHPEVLKYFENGTDRLPEGIHPSHSGIFVQAYCNEEISGHMPYRLRTVFREGQGLDIGGYRLWIEDDALWADRSRVFDGIEGYRLTGNTPRLGGRYELDIIIS